jgi:hypothetical protein
VKPILSHISYEESKKKQIQYGWTRNTFQWNYYPLRTESKVRRNTETCITFPVQFTIHDLAKIFYFGGVRFDGFANLNLKVWIDCNDLKTTKDQGLILLEHPLWQEDNLKRFHLHLCPIQVWINKFNGKILEKNGFNLWQRSWKFTVSKALAQSSRTRIVMILQSISFEMPTVILRRAVMVLWPGP